MTIPAEDILPHMVDISVNSLAYRVNKFKAICVNTKRKHFHEFVYTFITSRLPFETRRLPLYSLLSEFNFKIRLFSNKFHRFLYNFKTNTSFYSKIWFVLQENR